VLEPQWIEALQRESQQLLGRLVLAQKQQTPAGVGEKSRLIEPSHAFPGRILASAIQGGSGVVERLTARTLTPGARVKLGCERGRPCARAWTAMALRQARCGLHDRPRVRGSSRVDGVKGERPERVGRQIPVVGLAGGPERQVVVDLGGAQVV